MLIAAPERWDEACFAVPAIRAIAASGLVTGVLCREDQRLFWETVEGIVVVDFPVKAKAKVVAAGIAGAWQASMVWENGFTAEVFKLAEISKRLGPDEKRLKKLLTHPFTFSAKPLEHRVRYYLAAVEELGIATAKPEFFAPVRNADGLEMNSVMLCPGSDFGPTHEWPLERWKVVAEAVLQTGRHVTIANFGGAKGLGKTLADELGGRAEFYEASLFSETLPVLGAHGFVIAADGSLPHLAAHAGATCVTLFGPNDPAWKRPLGRRHSVVRRHVECAPCLLPKCPMDMRCQRELETERVLQAVGEKLA